MNAALQADLGWEAHSREFALRCAADGTILWLDPRAAARLGCEPGSNLLDCVVPGIEAKARALLQRASAGSVGGTEVPLVLQGRPTTVSFHSRLSAAGTIDLLGFCLPDEREPQLRRVQEAMQEIVTLNREIAQQTREIERQKRELERTVEELTDSNRGIAELHRELEDKAEVLQRTADVKGRVVANVSHEFRTPLHTILGLTRLLLDGADGPLTDEQRTQLQFIRQSADELTGMVDDLLDLASAEAGRLVLRPERFRAEDLLSSLRGTVRPLPRAAGVELRFGTAPEGLELETDQGKLSQVMRNLVSNALKFTEHGSVEISVDTRLDDVCFIVRDTGIGIAPEHHALVFEEFGQIDSPLQARTRGTGLGLPLSRRLAEMLGGVLTLDSRPGAGSTFTLRIPRVHPEARKMAEIEAQPLDPRRAPILVVEDDRKTIFIYEKYLAMAGYQVVPARSIADATRLLKQVRPAAIVLDIMLDGESSWGFLGRIKSAPETRDIPVLVVTVTNKEQKARALGADEFWLKPVDQEQLLRKLRSLKQGQEATRVLVIDDDARARYLISRYLDGEPYTVFEAATGAEGVVAAREHNPQIILLDFLLRGTTAFDVLDELKADPQTRKIPVIVVTSHTLDAQELERLASQAEVVLSKETLSRELAIHRIRDALAKAGLPTLESKRLGQ